MIGIAEPDLVRLVVLCITLFIFGAILAILVGTWGKTLVVPASGLRLILVGMLFFMGAVAYVLLKFVGTDIGEPISFLSIFAIAGLVFKLAGLFWIFRDTHAQAVAPEEAPGSRDPDSRTRATDQARPESIDREE